MPINAPANPFTMVHDALWKLIDDNPMWDSIVKPSSRIRYNSQTVRDPPKYEKQAADYPELTLMPAAGRVNTHETSCAAKYAVKYNWTLHTADWRSNVFLEQCQFAMFCSMANFKPMIESLVWPVTGERFVMRVDAQSFSIGGNDPRRSGGIVGWSAMWFNEIEIQLPRSALVTLATRQQCQ